MTAEIPMVPVRGKAVWGARIRGAAVIAVAAIITSCGTNVSNGTGSSYLIITQMVGIPGGGSSNGTGTGSAPFHSDVVADNGSKAADSGSATFQLQLKDPGGTASPNAPSANDFITLTGYHVQYVRTDGRNVQGVDVPYAFDGGLSVTVSSTATVPFTLVRLQAKLEAPLAALETNNIPFTAIAQVTFYAHDQTGRDASVTGNIEITFANYAG